MAGSESLETIVTRLLEACRERKLRLRTAESCTAGGIAAAIASVPGASDVLDRGWIVYSNEAKVEELGVPAGLIEAHGAVSREVVERMALGGARGEAVCVAVSGIAGPTGGTPDKPVGTVWMAVADGQELRGAHCFHFRGSRTEIQRQTVWMALQLLLRLTNM